MKASKAHTATSAFQAFVLALVIAVALAFVLIPVLPGETPLDVGDVAFTSFEADGETIVAEGQIVTETSLSLIKGAALLDNDIGLGEIFSGLLIAVLAGAFIGLYLYLFQPPEVNTNRRLVMYGLLVVLWVAGAKVFFSQALPDGERRHLPHLLPVAPAPEDPRPTPSIAGKLFTAALLAVVATFAGFYMPDARQSLSTGPMESLQMVTTFLLTGFVGVFAVRNAERMNNYASAGAGVGLMTIVLLFTFWLLLPNKDGTDLVWILGAGLVAGVGSVGTTMGGASVRGTAVVVATRPGEALRQSGPGESRPGPDARPAPMGLGRRWYPGIFGTH